MREHPFISSENAWWRSSNYLPRNKIRERCLDSYTGELLPKHLIRAAIEDKLTYVSSKVWKLSSTDEMMKDPDHVLVSSRWVMCNKGDGETPDCRAKLVPCEINKDGKADVFATSTPPLEAKRIIFAKLPHLGAKPTS